MPKNIFNNRHHKGGGVVVPEERGTLAAAAAAAAPAVYHTIEMESLDLSAYPPAPLVWTYTAVDTVCQPLGCDDWRNWVLPNSWTAPGAWLSTEYRLERPVSQLMPPLLTYEDFLNNQNGGGAAASKFSLSSLKTYAFETPSTALADVTTFTSFPVLVVIVLLIRSLKSILMPLFSKFGRRAALSTHGKEWEANNQERIVKFGEYVFRLCYHASISIAGIYYFWDKEWWKSGGTPSLFLEYPHQPIQPGMAWYYLVQSAYNIEAMLSLLELSFTITTATTTTKMPSSDSSSSTSSSASSSSSSGKRGLLPIRIEWSKDVRGDFREMFVHHVITNMLVIGSSFFRFTRVGSMVFLVHDVSDIPVDLSKLANFLKWKITTVICFVSMVICWCFTRLGILPFTIYRSVLYESWMVCTSGVIHPIYYVHYQPIFVILIGLLLLLHFAWFGMFIQMGWVLVSKGEAHDLSEHKKGEHAAVESKKTK